MPTKAELYFQQYSGENAAEILRSLPDSPEPIFENYHLDFKGGYSWNFQYKTASDPSAEGHLKRDKKREARNLKELWSEVVGAFSNSDGGVIVWGLVASRNAAVTGREIDYVHGLDLVENPHDLEDHLKSLSLEMTDPKVANIGFKTVLAPGEPAKGFVVCLIPRGAFKPYYSELPERYYRRAVDSNITVPREELKQMFYPVMSCNLLIQFTTHYVKWVDRIKLDMHDGSKALGINLSIANKGPASLREPFVQIVPSNGSIIEIPNPNRRDGHSGLPLEMKTHSEPIQAKLASLHPYMHMDFDFAALFPPDTSEIAGRIFIMSFNSPLLVAPYRISTSSQGAVVLPVQEVIDRPLFETV